MRVFGFRLQPSYLVATALAVAALLWVLSGIIGGASSPADVPTETAVEEPAERALTRVRVRRQSAETHRQVLVLRGQSAASRKVELRTEISSKIEAIGASGLCAVDLRGLRRSDNATRVRLEITLRVMEAGIALLSSEDDLLLRGRIDLGLFRVRPRVAVSEHQDDERVEA